MANRYWVGGNATWDSTAGTKWATSSGGAGGAAVPTAADDVFLDNGTGTGNVTLSSTSVCRSLNCTGYVGILTHPAATAFNIGDATAGAGNIALKLSAGMTYTKGNNLSSSINYISSSTTQQTVDYAGKTGGNLTFNGTGGSWILTSDFMEASVSCAFTVSYGTFNAGGFNVTVGIITSTGTNARSIVMGTGQWTVTATNATVYNVASSGMTFVRGTLPINFNNVGSTGTRTITHTNTGETSCPSILISAGTDTVNLSTGRFNNVDFTGFSGILGTALFLVWGSLTFSAGMTNTATTNVLTMCATSGSKTVTFNGTTLNRPLTFGENASTADWTLQDAVILDTARTLGLAHGTLNANNKNVTAGAFSSASTNTRILNMGTGTWTLTGTGTIWNTSTFTNLTINEQSSTIVLSNTSASTKTFSTNQHTQNYPSIVFAGGTGAFIMGASSYYNWSNTGSPMTIQLGIGTTTIRGSFLVQGTASNLVNLNSSTDGSQRTLSKASGVVRVDYLSIKDIAATGGATWYAGPHSINVSNNTGWIFGYGVSYSYQVLSSLPSNEAQLANAFDLTDYSEALADDTSYADSTGNNNYNAFVFSKAHTDNTTPISVRWKGKTDLSPASSPVIMQIYNYTTATWMPADSDNTTPAGTEFELLASVPVSPGNYYGSSNEVTVRVYQENT